MKTGDLEPPWRIAIGDSDHDADLTGVESWRFVASIGPAIIFTDEDPAITVGDDVWTATLEHVWVDGETDTRGTAKAEIVAVWPGGREQTFPSAGTATLTIEPSID
jgi:hypothetical protein